MEKHEYSVGVMLDELEWPSLEARRDQSSLFLFHMIHCGAVFIEKDKYMTPAHRLKTTRSSHSAQYRRHWSDILYPRTIPHWNSLSPVANTQSTEEFRARLTQTKIQPKVFVFLCCSCFVFELFLFFLFYQNFQIRNLWCYAQV